MPKQRKVIELFIDETNPMWGVDAISLVDYPAIEKNFIAFNQPKCNMTFVKPVPVSLARPEQRLVVGPALIPDKEIYRYDQDTGEEYWIKFSKETVKKASHLYMVRNNHHNATIQHAYSVNGLTTVETWVKDFENDKSVAMGFQVPIGTWMVMMKIDNDQIWNDIIKTKEVLGYSIEGFFCELAEMGKYMQFKDEDLEMDGMIEEIMKQLLAK